MLKYKASEIISYAKSLADLNNSNFLLWGDSVRMLNASYRRIYQDMVDAGELSYLQEATFIGKGTNKYALPDDFYQVAIICDDNGNEVPKRRLASYKSDTGYEIKNGTITLYNCAPNVIMKYYPIPETITYKKERTGTRTLAVASSIVSGFDTRVWISNGTAIDITTGNTINLAVPSSAALLGRDAVCTVSGSTGTIYYLVASASAVDTILHPLLTTNGGFIASSDNLPYGWSNDDGTARFMTDGTHLYYNGQLLLQNYNPGYDARCIYWNGKWALVTKDRIIYSDGSWETTDVRQELALLKCDSDTGYGYVVRSSTSQITVEGWTPDTTIDYPNHILFELTSYDLAIQFRMKQSADSTALKEAYDKLERTYWASINNDEANYVTIRNTDKRNFFGYW